MNWNAAEAVGTLLTALVALYLLWQGQRDRRKERDDSRSAQARDVVVRVEESWTLVNGNPNNKGFERAEVQILNESDRPIAVVSVDYVQHRFEEEDRWTVNLSHLVVTEDRLVMGRSTMSLDPAEAGGFAIAEFRDHRGQHWKRRSNDQELRRWPPTLRWWQRAVNFVCRASDPWSLSV